jgi:hypothetical protein
MPSIPGGSIHMPEAQFFINDATHERLPNWQLQAIIRVRPGFAE